MHRAGEIDTGAGCRAATTDCARAGTASPATTRLAFAAAPARRRLRRRSWEYADATAAKKSPAIGREKKANPSSPPPALFLSNDSDHAHVRQRKTIEVACIRRSIRAGIGNVDEIVFLHILRQHLVAHQNVDRVAGRAGN